MASSHEEEKEEEEEAAADIHLRREEKEKKRSRSAYTEQQGSGGPPLLPARVIIWFPQNYVVWACNGTLSLPPPLSSPLGKGRRGFSKKKKKRRERNSNTVSGHEWLLPSLPTCVRPRTKGDAATLTEPFPLFFLQGKLFCGSDN